MPAPVRRPQLNLRLDAPTALRLARLQARLGLSVASVVKLAIARLAQAEGVDVSTELP